jgi:tRNA A-37 threonylcarbamoyl transferase component Bud32
MVEDEEAARERRVDRLIADYLEAERAGTAPDTAELLRAYPDLAGELRSFLADREQFRRLAEPIRAPAPCPGPEAPTVDGGATDDPWAMCSPGSSAAPLLCPARPVVAGYEIEAELGRGGMGVVYKARQKSLHRVVALKMILAGRLASPADVARFRREAEAVAGLDHPNIVPIYDVGEQQGLPFFSMKLIEGRSLADWLRRRPAPADRAWTLAAIRILAQVARAVHYAHQHGILHRDLKPANVLLARRTTGPVVQEEGQPGWLSSEPHVTDFGLAKRIEGDAGHTQSGVVVGTPSYIAPEQASGQRRLTTAADVYGLGAILYEVLTGRPPFKAETPLDTLLEVVGKESVRPRALDAHADRDLETVCLKCLDKDPAKRYGSAEALAEDLERWLAGEPIRARRSGAVERLVKWARRRPAVAALAGLVIVVAALGGAGVVWQWQEAKNGWSAAEKKAEAEKAAREKTQEALAQAKQNLYFQRIALAERELSAGNLGRAEELLDECPPVLRGWEWHYLKRLRLGPPRVLGGKGSWVVGVALSPDGKLLASAGSSRLFLGEVKLWEVESGRERFALGGPLLRPGATAVAFSPDGKTLAASGIDAVIRLWDVATGKSVRILRGHGGAAVAVAFSPDGKRLASASFDGTVRVWDAEAGKELHVLRHADRALCVAFSPDGKYLASGGCDNVVRVWDAATGKEVSALRGPPGYVMGVAFSPDGQQLAAASGHRHKGEVQLWDREAWQGKK